MSPKIYLSLLKGVVTNPQDSEAVGKLEAETVFIFTDIYLRTGTKGGY
jgi:hypothetical protein